MTSQSVQSDDELRRFLIESIQNRLTELTVFSQTCEAEANDASNRKRINRWFNGIFGFLTALGGIVITQLPSEAETLRIYISLGHAIAGSIIATAGQFIDPAKSRERAIDLKNLKLRLDDLADEYQIEFLELKNDPVDTQRLIELNRNLKEKFAKLKSEAFEYGVDI